MTISKELLEASGLVIDVDQAARIMKANTHIDVAILVHQILCEKLEVRYCNAISPTYFIGTYDDAETNRFILCTKPKPIPAPKDVKVTEAMIDEIYAEWQKQDSGSSINIHFLKQKLFGSTNEN